jgi:micrococcal nuclease
MHFIARVLQGLLVAAYLTAASPSEVAGTVVAITDGDTITVLQDGIPERVRLHRIDCPERKQAFYGEAKRYAAELAFGTSVVVRIKGHDRWKRPIGEVILPHGRVLNHELVRAGFAWWFRKYAIGDTTLQSLEDEARTAKRGLWADPNPVSPWDFRTKSRNRSRIATPSTKSQFGALFFSNAIGKLAH